MPLECTLDGASQAAGGLVSWGGEEAPFTASDPKDCSSLGSCFCPLSLLPLPFTPTCQVGGPQPLGSLFSRLSPQLSLMGQFSSLLRPWGHFSA